jgi:hypothetical protein
MIHSLKNYYAALQRLDIRVLKKYNGILYLAVIFDYSNDKTKSTLFFPGEKKCLRNWGNTEPSTELTRDIRFYPRLDILLNTE